MSTLFAANRALQQGKTSISGLGNSFEHPALKQQAAVLKKTADDIRKSGLLDALDLAGTKQHHSFHSAAASQLGLFGPRAADKAKFAPQYGSALIDALDLALPAARKLAH